MKKSIYLILLLSCFFISSCTRHFSGGALQSSAALSQNNYSYIGNISGTAKVKYFLGIGGNKHLAIINEAKQDLYKKHPLKAGQAYVNFSTDVCNKYWIFGNTAIVTINADVVQFLENTYHSPDTMLNNQIQSNKNLILNTKSISLGLKAGDLVRFLNQDSEIIEGEITLISYSDSSAWIQSKGKKDFELIKTQVKLKDLAKVPPNKYGLSVNDKAKILISEKYYKCVIQSLTNEGANVKVKEEPYFDKIIFAPYNILEKDN